MSADEIKELAAEVGAGATFNADLSIAEALLDYAAMVERCEEMHDKFCMKFSINSDKAKTNPQFMKVAILLQDMFDYILKGTKDEET